MPSSEQKQFKMKNHHKNNKESKLLLKNPHQYNNNHSKKSLKGTPHHSKQKSESKTNNKANKQIEIRSDYYISSNQNKLKLEKPKRVCEEDVRLNNKKFRRNHPQQAKSNQNQVTSVYQSVALNDYHQPIKNLDQQTENREKLKNPLLKKIKMISSQGSIDFNGQIVRKHRLESDQYKNSFAQQASSHYYSPLGFDKDKKIGLKSKSKSKSGNKKSKILSKSKNKSKNKNSGERRQRSRESRSANELNYRNTLASSQKQRQSLIAQPQEALLLPTQNQLQQLHLEIQEDSQNVSEYLLSQQLIKQRGQCLNMLGKICSSMNLKRQTYSIAMCYIDSFIDINTEIKNIKTIVIASLMMALKIEHAEMIGSYGQFSTLSSMQSFTITKGLSMSTEAKSQQKRGSSKKQKNEEQYQNQQKPKFNLNRPKLPNVLTTVLSHQQIFSEYDRILCKQQIMDMQMQMMVKLNFKLSMKSSTYWVQTLTCLWDAFIMKFHPKLKNKVLFRHPEVFKNLSYLFQLLQISYYFPYAYFYPKAILVLSVMYLLVRIRIQFTTDKEDRGFQHYKNNLGKSTNIIFIDKMGTNELFGEFLGLLELDLGDIVNCCQYVSHYLNCKILRVFPFDPNRSMTYEQHACIYHYNPQIYRLFQLKCSNYADRNEI